MNTKPVILITTSTNPASDKFEQNKDYAQAIRQAGGLPVFLPTEDEFEEYDEYLDLADGLFLTGGQDILPNFYQELSVEGFAINWPMNPHRDIFEIEMTKRALQRGMPVFGICRGMQLLTVACKGSLYQDIHAQVDRAIPIRHFQDSTWSYPSHAIQVVRNSRLFDILGEETIQVNSLHHQAAHTVPDSLIITARAEDGVIEAIEGKGKAYALAVQWHPERLLSEDGKWLKLFSSFTDAAGAYHTTLER